MGKGDELVKFITEQVVQYIETPKAVRKQARLSQRSAREDWLYRWFGLVPFAIRMWAEERRERRKAK